MAQDSLKMQNKHGIKAPPLATEADIDKVMQWLVEVPFGVPTTIVGDAKLTYYHAGHIVHSAQAVLEIKQGYSIKRIGFTGDFNTEVKSVSVPPIEPLPRCNVVVGECTYSDPTRCYSMKKARRQRDFFSGTMGHRRLKQCEVLPLGLFQKIPSFQEASE